jgi:putative PIN family toxin of toxin-antitoxin system
VLLVIDTNVLLSGLLWRGPPHALLGKARDGAVDLALSAVLIEELLEVIARPKFADILARTSRTPKRILDELRVFVDVVAAPPLPRPICLRIPIVPATYSDHYPATVTDCKSGLLTAVSRQV